MSQTILQQGRLACLALTDAACVQTRDPDVVYLRTIAQDLERFLLKDDESSVHWVAVLDEPDTFGPPTRIWEFDDYLLHVGLAQGFSEGMLIHVFAQKSRYCLTDLVPLLRVKVLCAAPRAVREVEAVWRYFNGSEEFTKARTPRSQ